MHKGVQHSGQSAEVKNSVEGRWVESNSPVVSITKLEPHFSDVSVEWVLS